MYVQLGNKTHSLDLGLGLVTIASLEKFSKINQTSSSQKLLRPTDGPLNTSSACLILNYIVRPDLECCP